MTARADTLTLAGALEVCCHMRPLDEVCVGALRGMDFDREAFAVDRWQTNGPAWEFRDDAGVYAIGGLAFPNAWCGTFWLVAHERVDDLPPTDETWRKLIRMARTVIGNAIDPANPHARHRIEAYVLADWLAARRLVRHLGFVHEGTLRQAGSGGEDFEIWAQVAGGRKP